MRERERLQLYYTARNFYMMYEVLFFRPKI